MTPGVLLGIGLGGLVDGVVLHQILQWHHMLTSTGDHPATTVAGLEANTLADGLFHLGTLLVLFVAISLLWRRLRAGTSATWRSLVGSSLVGWGAFNIVEGLIDHQLLGIHHVRSGPDAFIWDMGYLALGASLFAIGWAFARVDRTRAISTIAGAAAVGSGEGAFVEVASSRAQPSSADGLPHPRPGIEGSRRSQEPVMSTEPNDLRKEIEDLKSAQAAQTATQAGQMATFSSMQAGMMATMVAGSVGLIAGLILGVVFGRAPRR